MVKTKSAEQAKKAWTDSIGRVPQRYAEGVQATTGFKEAALAGQTLYEQKMQDANVLARRQKGLEKSSDEDWKRGALQKGAQRIGQGMQAGQDKFATGIGRVISALQEVDLPPRVADPEANVLNRVLPIVRRLARLKEE